MNFSIERIENLFPRELSEQRKGRLRDGLKQFLSKNSESKIYSEFYSETEYSYFLQGDLIRDLRFPYWDFETREFSKKYFDALLISNTCDLDESNIRQIPKEIVIAKLITLKDFEEGLKHFNVLDQETVLRCLRNQEYSNLVYFPEIHGNEYIGVLDELSSITLEEINELKSNLNQNRIKTLDMFGYYLFMFKLSYHFCRLPEETDR